MFNATMFRPLVDYSDDDEDAEEEEEEEKANNNNVVKEERSEASKEVKEAAVGNINVQKQEPGHKKVDSNKVFDGFKGFEESSNLKLDSRQSWAVAKVI